MKTERIALKDATGFGVVVLGASAGGQSAIIAILRDLPLDFDVPIVVVQHLPAESTIVDLYAGRLPFAFEWVDEDSKLAARKVLLCPPRACIHLLPDGSFRVEPCEGGAIDKQIDCVLHSVARSFSHRAIGVVLTGMGNDGAAGARGLHLAGGRVLVQSETSADYPDMPRAAVSAGAADLVVPLRDMAQVLADLVAGAVRPKARSELDAIERVFGSEGEIAALAREVDWSGTPLGPALDWPLELRLMARTALESPHPASVWWGPELVQIYNEAWRRFLGVSKHPQALGGRAAETWREIWHDIGPMIERVTKEGVAVGGEDFLIVIDRHGFAEEVYADFAYSPIRDTHGAVVGVYNTCAETTQKVVAERRINALRELAVEISGAGTPRHACEQAAATLAGHPRDLPFVLLYLFDPGCRQATLAGAAGVEAGSAAAPRTITLVGPRDTWALQRVVEGSTMPGPPGVLLEDLDRRVPELASLLGGQRDRPVPAGVFVLPLRTAEDKLPIGALVAGLHPQRPFDDDYRTFVRLVAQQVGTGLVAARARQLELERLEGLADLNRAKTEFFANVSHEFRTPLTLLLTPLEEMLRRRDELPVALAAEVDVAARNSRRLLRLVDNLLDFSQIEQRRQRATMQPTDLALLTADVASAFRSAIERAGLRLRVHCEDNLPLVPIDREMWEKIVSNLLSNALKFTFDGEIVVRLNALSLHVELAVTDTGIGIPKHELANVFKRFHRVRGARARTIEGSGIGLAIVHDLVARMGGQIQVQSSEGRGSTFTVWIPLKSYRKALEPATAPVAEAPAVRVAAALAGEADSWAGERAPGASPDELLDAPTGEHLQRIAAGARVLVADDNADLREYLQRLLGSYWRVSAVADGAEALREARRQPPDLIVADVMMPNLDGFGLLRAVRGDEALKDIPVVFLTARAGEDTAIEGLLAGADDYLAKPFSARELIARVGGQIELSRARRRTQELNAFLVRFSDAVRGERDPDAIAAIARRMIRDRLGARNAYWCVVDWGTREYVVIDDADLPGNEPARMRQPMDAWEPFTTVYLQGRTLVVDDAATAAVDQAQRDGWAQMNIGAALAAPVLVEGTLRAVLGVDQATPRRWTPEDIALIQGLAGRCWPEVERARAEAALRESETKFRTVFETIDEGFALIEVLRDDAGRAVDLLYREVNQAVERNSGHRLTPGQRARETQPNIEESWLAYYDEVARTGEPVHAENFNVDTSRWYRFSLSRVGGDGSPLVSLVFSDITDRKRSEERQAFLLKLSDALRPLADPRDIQVAATRILGEHLAVNRVFYAEVKNDDWIVCHGYENGVPPLPDGPYSAETYGPWIMDTYRAGGRIVFRDTQRDSRFDGPQREAHAAAGIIGAVGVSFVKEGRLVAILAVHTNAPRDWTEEEIRLVEETAERTWAAVERARTEAVLAEELRHTKILQDLSATLVTEESVQAIYEQLLTAAIEITRADAGTVQMFDEKTRELVVLATRGFSEETRDYFRRVDAGSHTSCGLALQTGMRSFLDFDPASADKSTRLHVADGIRAAQSSPLVSRAGKPIGMVSTHWHEAGHRPSERELRFLDLLARQAADLIEQRTAETALRESEARYASLFAASPVPFMVLDPTPPDFTITGANEAYLAATKTTREGLIGRRLFDVFTDDPNRPGDHGSEALAISLDRVLKARLPDAMERTRYDLAKPGGGFEPHWWLAINAPLLDASGNVTAIIHQVTRVTELHLAEEAERKHQERLRESEEKYRLLFESIDEGFYFAEAIFDADGRCVDICYHDENPAAIRMIGQSAKGRRMSELAPYEQYWRDIFGHTARTGEPQRAERYAAPDGIWYEFYCLKPALARENQFVIIFRDVSASRRASEVLRQSEERQAFLLRLSDSLRAAPDEDAMAKAAVELTAAQMQVDRCWIAVHLPNEDRAVVAHDHRRAGLPSMQGEYRYSDFPETTRQMESGTLALDDIAADSSLADRDKAGFAALRIGAHLAAFLRKGDGRVTWSLLVADEAPRRWTREEIALLKEAAERTWTAIERARAEAALKEELGAMTRLHAFADRLLSITDVSTALGEVLDAAIGLFEADRGTLQIHDAQSDVLRYAVTRGFDEKMLASVPPIAGDFHSTCATAIRTGRRVVAADIPRDPQWADHAQTARELDYQAAISAPMKTRRDDLQGVISVHFRDPYTPTDRDLRYLDLYARLGAHLVERGRAEEALRASKDKYRKLFESLDEAS